ncbi:MAG: CDP-diacylglycerol--glycerol-3-phosphate 3-phosphatidyltransferase [Clostridia bacterium]|nr:CDP-diacylglycerol--glycerol-3-phosphate 3-phosphatidyltransferase [Clostridia bacterium]MEE1184529.1 CDP-diacylglycerol--glycerol-3-phosphate 3-phosphatidyltransferase [Acutalibacteraceae bacterium]
MNTPNKLTIARIIATPIFVAAMLIDFPYHYLVATILFIAASLTDMIDGKMARKYNLITDFGKFLDPLADKMLTTAAYLGFICMYADNYTYCWQITVITFIVLFREFMVSSIRLVTVSSGGKVVAANMWGKCKTVSQMLGIIFALFAYVLIDDFGIVSIQGVCDIVISVLFWASAVLCIISGVIYLAASKEYIDPSK